MFISGIELKKKLDKEYYRGCEASDRAILSLKDEIESLKQKHKKEIQDIELSNEKEIHNLKLSNERIVSKLNTDIQVLHDTHDTFIEVMVNERVASIIKENTELKERTAKAEAKSDVLEKAFAEIGFDVKDAKEMITKLIDGLIQNSGIKLLPTTTNNIKEVTEVKKK